VDYDPKGCITRRHFLAYKAGCGNAPPPLHVMSAAPDGNWYPAGRPLPGGMGAIPGPALNVGGTGMPCLGIDPTDPATWEGRGYRHSAGMIGYLNHPDAIR
jgi:hypothetical protein